MALAPGRDFGQGQLRGSSPRPLERHRRGHQGVPDRERARGVPHRAAAALQVPVLMTY
jgi:hypothetical protein